ncbi:MAG TPA: SEC-C metal-binding domain-containing protein [Vicinamibacteria bacterium]|nr:SEC-C metal-binding domain-containing protein [Vicinamibacteria bacterium]
MNAKALWDTGASKSVISGALARALAVAPVGSAKINHAGGISQSPTYLLNFGLPHRVLIAGILACEFQEAPNGFNAIVGMDVICSGDFAITNVGGRSCVSFRTPSCETIDYVVEANRVRYAGVGRNDPCPCGKGKKFKKCHGAA